jgi:hypothetical protein
MTVVSVLDLALQHVLYVGDFSHFVALDLLAYHHEVGDARGPDECSGGHQFLATVQGYVPIGEGA